MSGFPAQGCELLLFRESCGPIHGKTSGSGAPQTSPNVCQLMLRSFGDVVVSSKHSMATATMSPSAIVLPTQSTSAAFSLLTEIFVVIRPKYLAGLGQGYY